jgi:hypothetical protein
LFPEIIDIFVNLKIGKMIKIEEIKKEINSLSLDDFRRLKDWIIEKEWNNWDKEIIRDSESGELDFLIEEAKDAGYLNSINDL